MLQITGKHIDITESIRSYCEEQFEKIEEHAYLSNKSLSFGKNNHLYNVVATIKTDNGEDFTGSAESKDCYQAINMACKRLKKQLDKSNGKKVKRRHEKLDTDLNEELVDMVG